MVGRTVVGRFRVERIIGRGGMASVYAAIDERSGQEIALKLLKRELTRDPTVLRRFEREAKAAAHLVHPNIIQVFDSGIDDEDAYIAMELANGKDLLKALSQERPMRQTRAALVLAQVCAALDVAHGKGIVHRDLKPENIVLVPDPSEPGGERAKVLDFGIAKILDVSKPGGGSGDPTDPPSYVTKTALTRVGTIVGTPAYMSPEQCRGGDLDGRSDIYTCGVLLYQLVTGELPFTGETPLHTAMRHIHAQPRPPHELRRDIHPALERIILKALAKWPGERHQTATQLREELAAAVPDLPDRGDVVIPAGYVTGKPAGLAPAQPTTPDAGEPPDSDPVQPTRMLVGGPLGSTPLRAVRLGGPGNAPSPAAAEPPAGPAPAEPPAAEPVDDDDEPRTFLMQPEGAERALAQATSVAKDARREAESPRAAAVQPSHASSAPPPPVKPAVRTAQMSATGAIRAGVTRSSPPGATAAAHAKTAPAGGPVAPGAGGGLVRPPARSDKPTRPPKSPPRPPATPLPPRASSAPVAHTKPSNTETGLTPTSVAHVPSSNDPPTHKKAVQPPAAPSVPPVSATAAAPTRPADTTRDPRASVDDDEVSTHVREPGPPDRQRGANQTLVMEEPHQGGNAAPPPSAHSPAVRGREMTVAPTLLANQNAPTGPEIEAGALRALKETTRMASEDSSAGLATINAAIAARSGTMRMNPPDSNAYASGPASVQVNPAYAAGQPQQVPPSASGPNLAPLATGVGGWNESTVMRRRPDASRAPGQAPTGIVGELASLPGTTGFLIGIGLGLGIAAGVVIALLVMR